MNWLKIDENIPLNVELAFVNNVKDNMPSIISTVINDSEYGLLIVGIEDYISLKEFTHYCVITKP